MTVPTVLVVEDNAMNRKLFRTLLAVEGYDVHVAESAEEALRALETLRPDLILTDIQMPGMDGVSFTKKIKEMPELLGVPVVALTAYAMRGDRERFLAAGCDGYISKPIDPKTFPGVVASYLPKA